MKLSYIQMVHNIDGTIADNTLYVHNIFRLIARMDRLNIISIRNVNIQYIDILAKLYDIKPHGYIIWHDMRLIGNMTFVHPIVPKNANSIKNVTLMIHETDNG